MQTNRITNQNFFAEYEYFDFYLSEYLKVDEDKGVETYMKRMKEAVIEAREAIAEWDVTYDRLKKIKNRYEGLSTQETSFDEFQGKDEDVVWIRIFISKIESKADPLSKYKNLNFSYKTRKKSLIQIILDMFK
ncbi:MAG: hypothetical protein IKP29_09405 [Pseudobutyrivibrio sp.]|nr:hypothetical protein [Pseudobutyrivibrio sp.]